MREFRYVPTRWNLTPEFLELSPDARCLLFAIWTWPDTPTTGLGVLDLVSIAHQIGIQGKRAATCAAQLAKDGYVRLDESGRTKLVWITDFWEAQVGCTPNRNHRLNTAREINKLPRLPLVNAYIAHHQLEPEIRSVAESAKASRNRVSDRVSPTHPIPMEIGLPHGLPFARPLPDPYPSLPTPTRGTDKARPGKAKRTATGQTKREAR